MHKVCALVVTYNPDVKHLERLLQVLLPQVNSILVIDNKSLDFNANDLTVKSQKLEYIFNEHNLGLATAYNHACIIARARGYTHIVLLDQDSLPAVDMIHMLLNVITKRNQFELVTAAVGPKYCDVKGQQRSPFVKIKNFHLERVECTEDEVVEVDHLISSGSLIDLRVFDRVGAFVDELFIDCIDTEWCLRVRRHRLNILGVGNAAMGHNIGERYLSVFNRKLPMHTPLRLQYQFRNQIWLIKQPCVGWRWRVIDAVRCLKLIAVYMIFAPNKCINLGAIAKGIFNGLMNKMGKI